MIVVQPYYFWNGHYRQYANSLKSNINIFLDKKKKFKPILEKNKISIFHILSRFLNYFYAIIIILKILNFLNESSFSVSPNRASYLSQSLQESGV
jgi:hypothetical protein